MENKFKILVIDIDKESISPEHPLELSAITLKEEYAKKWQAEHISGFFLLTRGHVPIRQTLYRKGGISGQGGIPEDQDYFMLLKYTEAQYSKEFLNRAKSNMNKLNIAGGLTSNYLKDSWVILDKQGNELVEIGGDASYPYLVKNSVIYSLGGYYYNLLTGEKICTSSGSLQSAEFIFVDNNYDDDKAKRGMWKICKKDASVEIFK